MSVEFLHKIADVLEAVAEEKSQLASELGAIKLAEKKKRLEPLIDKLSFVSPDNTEELESKLSSLDTDTLDLLSKVAGDNAAQLGGSYKHASFTGGLDKSRADDDFATWILS